MRRALCWSQLGAGTPPPHSRPSACPASSPSQVPNKSRTLESGFPAALLFPRCMGDLPPSALHPPSHPLTSPGSRPPFHPRSHLLCPSPSPTRGHRKDSKDRSWGHVPATVPGQHPGVHLAYCCATSLFDDTDGFQAGPLSRAGESSTGSLLAPVPVLGGGGAETLRGVEPPDVARDLPKVSPHVQSFIGLSSQG